MPKGYLERNERRGSLRVDQIRLRSRPSTSALLFLLCRLSDADTEFPEQGQVAIAERDVLEVCR